MSLAARLSELRDGYVSDLLAQQEALSRLLHCIGRTHDRVRVQELSLRLHHVFGAAGVHGLSEVSTAAQHLMHRLAADTNVETIEAWPESIALFTAIEALKSTEDRRG